MSRIALLVLAAIATPVMSANRLVDLAIVDRDSGRELTAHFHHGEYWVAGRPGAHYAIRIQSRDGRRLLAVTSVDGVNILTGETAAHGQRGYVFEPWQGYDLAGWRKSDSQIAAFTFTSIPKSYAARTGRPQNVGVIGVAVFAEKQYPPKIALQAPVTSSPLPAATADELEEVQIAGTRVQGGRGDARAESADRARESKRAAPGLGTGHGRREHSLVTQVPFERASETPDEIIRIRYDSRENLVAMGVIHETRPRVPDAFPDSPKPGYVPDP